LGDFQLTDHNGAAFNLKNLKGKWTFLYFGYMTCSDLCPTTMSAMSNTYDTLIKSELGVDDLQFAFVSVDPHRDSLENLKQYVAYFNPKFLGVTGSREELDKLNFYVGAKYGYEDIKTHKVVADVKELTDDENYIVRHFGDLFVIDPQASLVAYVYPYHEDRKLVATYNKIRSYY
jgi:protein SCO1/2